MSLLDSMQWRYATKKYSPERKVEQHLVDQIVEAAWLAPTSSGLQPFKIVEISNKEIKEKIVPLARNQKLVSECSHLLVFAAWDNYTAERIDHIYRHTAHVRKQDIGFYKAYTDRLKKSYLKRTATDNYNHGALQVYLALGLAIAMAAELRVDSTPIEGFDDHALDRLLSLHHQGLKCVVLLALGYRDEDNDWLAGLKKIRHPKEEFIIKIQ